MGHTERLSPERSPVEGREGREDILMLPPLVLNLVLGLHPNPWAAGVEEMGVGVVEGFRAF